MAEVTIVGNQEQSTFARDVLDDIEEGEVLDDTVEEETFKEREEHLAAVESQRPTEVAPRHMDVAPAEAWPANPPPPPPAPERGPKSAG